MNKIVYALVDFAENSDVPPYTAVYEKLENAVGHFNRLLKLYRADKSTSLSERKNEYVPYYGDCVGGFYCKAVFNILDRFGHPCCRTIQVRRFILQEYEDAILNEETKTGKQVKNQEAE